jgi:Uma2 family endonuclease
MNLIPPPAPLPGPVVYPDSDGKPMADNTKQARWIVVLFGNIAALFRSRGDVFVAMDLLWYAVEGFPEVRAAPDVLVVFGRPRGDRGSYRQWEEGNVAVTVAFEVLSPGNTYTEMTDKLLFYEEHGVEEYYVFDPDRNRLEVHLRQGEMLRPVRPAHGFVSPRLGIRFDLSGAEMAVFAPDGRRFLSFEELQANATACKRNGTTCKFNVTANDSDRPGWRSLGARPGGRKPPRRNCRSWNAWKTRRCRPGSPSPPVAPPGAAARQRRLARGGARAADGLAGGVRSGSGAGDHNLPVR